MIIRYDDFKIAGMKPGNTMTGKPEQAEKKPEATGRQYMLEGLRDMYEGLPDTSDRKIKDGPIYPTIGKKLFPAMDALETTVGQLGKRPSPEEVDRSNVRRLIRAFQPVAEAHRGSYDKKDFKKAMQRFQKVASALGKYKDVAVIETEIKGISPGGVIPGDISKKLAKLKGKRAEQFDKVYKDFRKKDMKKAVKVMTRPVAAAEDRPEKIDARDRTIMGQYLDEQLMEVREHGVDHKDPDKFHEGRKATRKLLNGMNASQDVFGYDKKDVDALTSLVSVYGVAQDKQIAYEWLEKEGFEKQAGVMKQTYLKKQEEALAAGRKTMESGVLDRVKAKITY